MKSLVMVMTAPPEKGAVHEYQSDLPASRSKWNGSLGFLLDAHVALQAFEQVASDPVRAQLDPAADDNRGLGLPQ